MKKPKINMTIIKEDIGYGAHSLVNNISINTQGDTFDELKEMILDAVNLAFEEKGFVYGIDEISFTYDLSSFFAFYKVINASALSKRKGRNSAQPCETSIFHGFYLENSKVK